MPSFVALCPRGHMGNFITLPTNDYHVCSCNLHIPVFNIPTDEPNTLEEMEIIIKERVDERVAELIDSAIQYREREIDQEYSHKLEHYQDRLSQIDPEWNDAKEK